MAARAAASQTAANGPRRLTTGSVAPTEERYAYGQAKPPVMTRIKPLKVWHICARSP